MEEINYNGKYISFTKLQFEKKDKLISNDLYAENSKYNGGETNYANPLIGTNGRCYMVINNEVLSYFTQAELDSSVNFEDIKINNKL